MRNLWPRGGLWRHPDFLRFWSAQTISQVGTQITVVAFPLVAIIVLEASAFEVALLTALEFLPFLLFALPAGVWVDRLPRKPILVVSDLVRGAALASVPLAHAADVLTLWQVYGVAFVAGTFTVTFDVAYMSYLPALVSREQLVEGNAKLEASRSGAQIGGPGLGGVLVGLVTAPYAIGVDAASYLASALFLFAIVAVEPAVTSTSQSSMRREVVEGLRYLFRHRLWRPFAVSVATSNFFGNVAWAVVLVYAVRTLHLSPEEIGLVLMLGGVGALGGAMAARPLSSRFGVGPTIVVSSAMFGPSLLVVPVAPEAFPVPFLVASMAIASFGVVAFNVTAISLVQTITPSRLLGRFNASRRFIVWGVIPLGSLVGGALATWIGLRGAIFVGAIGSAFAFVPVLLSPMRSIREMPEPEEPVPLAVPFAAPTDA